MKPEPVFEDPWHAQVFALTVHLNERGAFSWPDWAQVFGVELSQRGVERELNGGGDYFEAWLAALETICTTRGFAEPAALLRLKSAWEEAYLDTPHGAPVRLAEAPS